MSDCKPLTTPMDINQKLSKSMSPKSEEEREQMLKCPYQELVGSLLFVAQVSRPDICYAVNTVSRFNNNPGKLHWIAVKRIVRYLKQTSKYKLCFQQQEDGPPRITGYCDSDFASDIDERKSTSGYVFKMHGGSISWCSKKQPTVALSTTEAEYMSLSLSMQEGLWLQNLQKELQPNSPKMHIFCDSQSAIHLASTNSYHSRTKHIDVKHHYIRNIINDGKIILEYIPTEQMVADALTKPLPALKNNYCAESMGLFK